jgi:hypothetical protein
VQFIDTLRQHAGDPETLEKTYRTAVTEHRAAAFKQDVEACHAEQPDNLLYAAWHFRLQGAALAARHIAWQIALPLALVSMLIYWWISSDAYQVQDHLPLLVLLWSPVAAILVMGFLSAASKTNVRKAVWLSILLIGASAYAYFVLSWMKISTEQAADLLALHMPVLSWMVLAIFTSGIRSSYHQRFSFLIKSLELFTFAGLFLIAGAIFEAVTFGLFEALGISIPDGITRLLIFGGLGLLPVVAVAMIYDPSHSPQEQDFENGISRFLSGLLRILVIPTLGVALVYLLFIPFNFNRPFEDRDVLIIYNAMLFAVMGLLLGATPLNLDDLAPRTQTVLRWIIAAIAGIAAIVSLYALSAVVYRTAQDTLTMNRLMIIGWNTINIGLLVYLLVNQIRRVRETWAESLQRTFAAIVPTYTLWALFIIIAIPLLFGR